MSFEKFFPEWNKTDVECESCHQVTKRQRGLTKQNVKRLFSFKWNINELIFLLIVIMLLVLAYSYNTETKQCREWLKPMFSGSEIACKSVCLNKCELAYQNRTEPNINETNFTLQDIPVQGFNP